MLVFLLRRTWWAEASLPSSGASSQTALDGSLSSRFRYCPCTVVFSALFGLSTTYWMAIATRLVLGALNGLLAPIKAYCVEVCQTQHQALGLSLVNTAWALGLIVGPALGGYLSQPAEKYPHVFSKDSVFGRFPYLLPCLSVSAFATLVLISCEWLPETIHKHKVPEMDTKAFKALSSKEGYCDPPRKKKSLLQNRPWISTLLPYCFFSLHDTAYSEILSLWAVSDRKYGGLSFSTEDTGQVLAMAGASLLVYQLVIYRWVHRILGTVNSARIASAVSILVLATYPFMTYLSGVKLSLALCSAAMMRSALAITVTTGISLLQNNAVVRMKSMPRTKRHRKWYIDNCNVILQVNCSSRCRGSILMGTKTSRCCFPAR
uniref:Major facilitator superfamily (MFS) profile domain-containing protein n=1 Tax=Zea mays TaxID=4577 RepID=A0A804NIU8_MAIZE